MEREIRILYCDCAHADVLPETVKQTVLGKLRDGRVKFEAVRDLCGLAARQDPLLAEAAGADEVRIAACHPRAVKCLFEMAGVKLTDGQARFLNMRADDAESVVGGLLEGDVPTKCACCGDEVVFADGDGLKDGWMPWFPVIDRERCTNCRQCLSFCLFGVFAVGEDGRVEVRQPANCKTGCPACSRVCPNVAIVFPKYDKRPINGDEVQEGDGSPDPVKVDVGKLVQGGVQASLRSRTQRAGGRFSATGGDDGEGIARLRKMQAELDIPESVINKLAAERGCSCGCGEEAGASESPTETHDEAAAGESCACGCVEDKEASTEQAGDRCSCQMDDTVEESGDDADSNEEWDL